MDKEKFEEALAAIKEGNNPSGMEPTEYKIVILSDYVDPMEKGFHKPERVIEKEQWAQTEGYVVAISAMAFTDDGTPWLCDTPTVGDKVVYAKYAGQVQERNGIAYRLITDKDLCAIIKE